MSPLPTTGRDLRAVVRALADLTTQVKRIADARQSDFALTPDAADDAPTTAADDGPRIERPVALATPCGHCGHPYNWHASRGACEFADQTTGCGCSRFRPGAAPEPIDPWCILGAEAPAADEDTLRWTRRESLTILINRILNGLHISSAEAGLLRQHVEAEIREHDTARSEVQRLGLMVDEYGRGARHLSEQLRKARRAADLLAGAHRRAEQLEAAAREVLGICGDQHSDVQDILRAALDGTEQPTTEAP
ncbi:hypothetical protein G3M58_36840 [Streptomyces sp. SID7499]|uniref:Uncharacterized protein n=1 Tax=Streptomyces sp. SID7499 TaxID=2706086 RepID=A0A6G3X2W9_9ACTN|nr:hypothetical protein [Streptomyces sp. SID7499]